MVFSKETIVVETDTTDRGQSEEVVTAISNLNGESVTVRVNSDYVMDFLKHAGKQVKCGLTDSASMLLFTDDSDFHYLVAPMRL